ncbi:MAG: ASCH domain-containing protein [Candidatus Nanoarchaeia archaeon]|nr:ASCH domain-containing protein [Candidatus Nanoarchaeia archaeon]
MVKVLSLKQPWAHLLATGKKTIELRTWHTKYRGEFYIHASKNINLEECRKLNLNPKELITGAIIGKCTITGIRKYNTEKEMKHDYNKHLASSYKIPCYGFIIENAETITPIKAKGKLNFFEYNL